MADLNRLGKGNWAAFDSSMVPAFESAAKEWAEAVRGVRKPWLCWHTNPRWCLLQQRLALSAGWTPVVGGDPRAGRPETLPESIYIDFNRTLQLPLMYPHVPVEWAFLWAERLAFWHADFICTHGDMKQVSAQFEALPDGEMAAFLTRGGIANLLKFRTHRYWEVLGCTTRGASESQYRHGAGWWRHIECHVNAPASEMALRKSYYYDHGVGIMYWHRQFKGVVHRLPDALLIGHCTSINNPNFQAVCTDAHRDLSKELDKNFDLESLARKFGIEDMLG
jgi:hypothetical protein